MKILRLIHLRSAGRTGAGHPDVPAVSGEVCHTVWSRWFRKSLWLFAITILTTTWAGYLWDYDFRVHLGYHVPLFDELAARPWMFLRGLFYSVSLLLILGAHEMGHYLACRFHGMVSTPPYFLPFPSWPDFFHGLGTLGAFIKIRSPFHNRCHLFDVGVAGPLAGFCVAVPLLLLGLILSQTTSLSSSLIDGVPFGNSLLTGFMASLFPQTTGAIPVTHPIFRATLFGLFATSLNLLPVGQLDGGHVVYALFGKKIHKLVSMVTFLGLVILSVISWRAPVYLTFCVILLIMKLRHPATLTDDIPLSHGRKKIALLVLIVFLLTFIPQPIQLSGENPPTDESSIRGGSDPNVSLPVSMHCNHP